MDYRVLNSVTVKDVYPIPQIDDSLGALSDSYWFLTLDMASGYRQAAMDMETNNITVFFEWTVMPFGLCNAPGTF